MELLKHNVQFEGFNCTLLKGEYQEGGIALQLVDAEDGEPVATPTIFLPEVSLEKDEILIKSYSENEGMMESLMIQGVIDGPIESIPTGHVTVTKHKLLI
jgi:hypothetical protein